MHRRHLLETMAAAAAVTAGGRTPRAQSLDVDLRLVLAIDVSRSIDEEEARLQREGYVQALTDRHVVSSMTDGPFQRTALAYVEWAGTHYQRTLVDWTLIDSPAAAHEFAGKLAEAPYTSQSWTAVGAGLAYAASKFDELGYVSRRKVIDISGDGKTNNGPPAELVRDELVNRVSSSTGCPSSTTARTLAGRPRKTSTPTTSRT